MLVSAPHPVIQDILRALGLQGKNVISLELRIAVDELVTLKIERRMSEEEVRQLSYVFQLMTLEEIEENDSSADGARKTNSP